MQNVLPEDPSLQRKGKRNVIRTYRKGRAWRNKRSGKCETLSKDKFNRSATKLESKENSKEKRNYLGNWLCSHSNNHFVLIGLDRNFATSGSAGSTSSWGTSATKSAATGGKSCCAAITKQKRKHFEEKVAGGGTGQGPNRTDAVAAKEVVQQWPWILINLYCSILINIQWE